MKVRRIYLGIIAVILLGAIITYINTNLYIATWSGFDNYKVDTSYYLSYSIEREGIAKPKIRKIVLIDDKGDVIKESGFEYSFYADYGSRIGAFRDDIIDNDGIVRIEKLKDIKGYYVEGRENEAIVIKISFEEGFDVTSIDGFKIYYSVLGIPKCKSQRVSSFKLGIEP